MNRTGLIVIAIGLFVLFGSNGSAAKNKSPETVAVIDSALSDSTALTGKVVLVDFWASWCVPCRKSYPWMESLLAKYHDMGFEVVTVNVDKDRQAADKFTAQMKSALPVIYDPKGELARLYELKVMPSSFVYGRDGTLKANHEGFQPSDGPVLDSLIATLLKESVAK